MKAANAETFMSVVQGRNNHKNECYLSLIRKKVKIFYTIVYKVNIYDVQS